MFARNRASRHAMLSTPDRLATTLYSMCHDAKNAGIKHTNKAAKAPQLGPAPSGGSNPDAKTIARIDNKGLSPSGEIMATPVANTSVITIWANHARGIPRKVEKMLAQAAFRIESKGGNLSMRQRTTASIRMTGTRATTIPGNVTTTAGMATFASAGVVAARNKDNLIARLTNFLSTPPVIPL